MFIVTVGVFASAPATSDYAMKRSIDEKYGTQYILIGEARDQIEKCFK